MNIRSKVTGRNRFMMNDVLHQGELLIRLWSLMVEDKWYRIDIWYRRCDVSIQSTCELVKLHSNELQLDWKLNIWTSSCSQPRILIKCIRMNKEFCGKMVLKARLVAKGFQDQATLEMVLLGIFYGCHWNNFKEMGCESMDIKTAFL